MKRIIFTFILLMGLASVQYAQDQNGQYIFLPPSQENDSIGFVTLNTVTISAKDQSHDLSYYRNRRLRYNVFKVYPYAMRAVEVMNEIEDTISHIDRNRHQKKYKKNLEDELKGKFKDDLKKLSKSQGKILIKIIERETGRHFYDILKELKRPAYAFKWQTLAKMYGYNLKEGYDPIKYKDIEEVLLSIQEGKTYLRYK